MTKIYFAYKFGHDNHTGNRYSPIAPFATMFPFYVNLGIVTLDDCVVGEDNLKKFGFDVTGTLVESESGQMPDERLGIVEVDDIKLASLGKDASTVTSKLANVGNQCDVELMTEAEAIVWMKTFTTCIETTPGTFQISAAGTDIDGTPTEAVLLTI